MVAPEAAVGSHAQVGDGIVLGVDPLRLRRLTRKQQRPFFGNHQEQQAVNQPQELAVVLRSVEAAALQPFPQFGAVGVLEKRCPQRFDRGLHAFAQSVADAPAFLDALVVVMLQQRVVRGGAVVREAGRVEQPVEHGELAVLVPVDHALQVELQVGRLGEAGRVP